MRGEGSQRPSFESEAVQECANFVEFEKCCKNINEQNRRRYNRELASGKFAVLVTFIHGVQHEGMLNVMNDYRKYKCSMRSTVHDFIVRSSPVHSISSLRPSDCASK